MQDGHARNEQIVAPSTQIEIFPEFSPDGSQLASVSNRSGAYDVWVVGVSGQAKPMRGESAGSMEARQEISGGHATDGSLPSPRT